ncbi:SDR family oxidoreductase [Entomobacter blattae]|uniref:NAD-dependent glycerol dehydrogenase n=1 Tax=Entomobacter blattae TaxID=2762277 RepID=A0A7H1NTW7_9PROT|nr:D-threitol dehydrogenase [Entomobacter blattae]QNT79227.1 NAD-dependent glycerol dehydrogenase [Entomobacter blattae]
MSENTFCDLSGRVAVITGGGAGIGFEIAKTFLQQNAKVVLVDVLDDIDQIAKNLSPENAFGIRLDVTSSVSVNAVIGKIAAQWGKIDIAVNCAGVALLSKAEEMSEDLWDKTLTINLKGTFLVSQAVGRIMLKHKYGRIINMASQAAVIALPQHLAYCASKAGVIGLTQVLALEWGPVGITVNAISPTIVMTELGKKVWSGTKGDEMKQQIPVRKFAEPHHIAAAALYLASEEAAMVNGSNLVVDGGYSIQ